MTHQDRHLRELTDDFEQDWLNLETDDVDPARPDTQRVAHETRKLRAQLFGKGSANSHYASSARPDHGGDHSRWR